MIHDVKITPLKIISDERGKVMHMLRADNAFFDKFGEIYFSTIFFSVLVFWLAFFYFSENVLELSASDFDESRWK